MALVGGLVFCTACGNLLDRQSSHIPIIICDICKTSNPNNWPAVQSSRSQPTAFPSALQRRVSGRIQILEPKDMETWVSVRRTCPECENPEMKFRDVQLRGADEGTTVFYYCPNCHHRFKNDN